jgi:hypothetical protein
MLVGYERATGGILARSGMTGVEIGPRTGATLSHLGKPTRTKSDQRSI